MGRFLTCFISLLAALTLPGCKADPASRASSQIDSNSGARAPMEAPSPTPSPAPGPRTSLPDNRPLVVCFGDSLTAGYGADDGQSYPDFLQHDLDHDGFHYRVVNEGVSGNTTKDGVDRLAEVLALKPAVVVLEFGGNDGLRGFKVSTTRSNLSSMIEALKKSGAKIVLAGITLPPDYGADYVNDFTANYPTLGKKYDLPVLPFLFQNVYGNPGMMQADGIHATNKGNEIVARNILPLVEPLLKK